MAPLELEKEGVPDPKVLTPLHTPDCSSLQLWLGSLGASWQTPPSGQEGGERQVTDHRFPSHPIPKTPM